MENRPAEPASEPAPERAFVPDEAWIDAFQGQATHELRMRAKRFARSRARFVSRAGGHVDDYYVSSLVQDVLTDTLFGVLAWDPNTISLEGHVFAAIRSRTHHDCVRAARFKHRSVDVFDSRAEATSVMTAVEVSLSFDQFAPSAASLAFSDEVIAQVRELAKEDAVVLRMLDAIAEGATEKREIMYLAKMSPKTYHKAHIRLGRLVERLSHSIVTGLRTRA